jgi:hypothetical protein
VFRAGIVWQRNERSGDTVVQQVAVVFGYVMGGYLAVLAF